MVSSMKSAVNRKVNYNAVQTPIIEGHFPSHVNYRELQVFKFNRFLSFALGITILVSMISYSMVVAKESAVITAHNRTHEINFENIELQNKVDHTKSFYNMNEKIAKIGFLKKADKVLEVKESALILNLNQNADKISVKSIPGY